MWVDERNHIFDTLVSTEDFSIIKPRTLKTNYCGTIASAKFLLREFQADIEELGFSDEGFEEWIKADLKEMVRRVHIEPDNSINYTLRYIHGIVDFLSTQSRNEILKIFRIVTTKKDDLKYAIAFHPHGNHTFDCIDGAKLELVRTHTLRLGGRIDVQTLKERAAKATLLRDRIGDEDEIDEDTSSDDWMAKPAILFPITICSSGLIIKICKMTKADYFFLADKETPSDYLCSIRNSTQIDGGRTLSSFMKKIFYRKKGVFA